LRHWRLLELHDEHGLAFSRLRIDERILHFLAGLNYLDPRLRGPISLVRTQALMGRDQLAAARTALQRLRARDGAGTVVQLHGDDSEGQREVSAWIAHELGLRLYGLRTRELPENPAAMRSLAGLWTRDSLLLGAAMLVDVEPGGDETLRHFVEYAGGLVFVRGRHATAAPRVELRLRIDRPTATEHREMWSRALGGDAGRLNGSLDVIATQFRGHADVIDGARRVLAASGAGDPVEALVMQSCRESSRLRLDDLAQRVEPAAGWEDLVLPDAQLSTLRQIAAQVRRRIKVYEEWGFARKGGRGFGVSALFTGESGTGKTLAAEVLANELQLDLYRIDLASMVSKYIGETEKNLRRVFDAAEDGGVILLFDEADALFGKRSEVADSHDRYANIEVSYLLQRMEAYRGLAILTTNFKSALDVAFQRRLRFIVPFPFPDVGQRERIWRAMFPAGAPRAGLDFRKLAQLNAAGGHIRNIVLNAAFLAAEATAPIDMSHVMQAARAEGMKRERPFSEGEFRGWA
jgi:hypothetical protein